MANANLHSTSVDLDPPLAASAARTELTRPAVNFVDWIALIMLIIGGLNWALVGLTNTDAVASLFGSGTPIARIVYVLVGIAALWAIFLALRLGRRVA